MPAPRPAPISRPTADQVRDVLAQAEVTLIRRAGRARTPRSTDAVGRALAAVCTQRVALDRASGQLHHPARPAQPRTVTARLSEVAQLIGLGQLARAGALLDGVEAKLAELDRRDYDPLVLRVAGLREQLAPAGPAVGRTPEERPSSSVRTVSGGLPTLGRRR